MFLRGEKPYEVITEGEIQIAGCLCKTTTLTHKDAYRLRIIQLRTYNFTRKWMIYPGNIDVEIRSDV